MRLLLLSCLLLAAASAAYAAPSAWLLTVDRWGNAEHRELNVELEGSSIAGSLDGWPVTGRRDGDRLAFEAVDRHGAPHRFEATVLGERLTSWADYPDTSNYARARHAFSAIRLDAPEGPPRRLTYNPQSFSNTFTADLTPALVIRPGDIVSTRTIDSGGVDEHGAVAALYGNPQTGPFYVAGAKAGDVLAVHIRRISLNRDYADSLDGVAGRAMSLGPAARAGGLGKRVRWRLDRARGLASLQSAPDNLKIYVAPVRPMLGGLGVAPDFGLPPQSAGDSGRWGGNMDFNGIVEGATVYLPVFRPGAMLFLGDGHALQGDDETTQWALETSLDVEFSVELLASRPPAGPRIATAQRLSVLGQASSLDEAVRAATGAMIQWLEQDYGLSASEASLMLGVAAEYRSATLAGRNASVALSLERSRLPATKGH